MTKCNRAYKHVLITNLALMVILHVVRQCLNQKYLFKIIFFSRFGFCFLEESVNWFVCNIYFFFCYCCHCWHIFCLFVLFLLSSYLDSRYTFKVNQNRKTFWRKTKNFNLKQIFYFDFIEWIFHLDIYLFIPIRKKKTTSSAQKNNTNERKETKRICFW